MINYLQILGIAFALFMIYFSVLHYRRKEVNLVEVCIWFIVWSFVIIAVIFPDILQLFAREFLFARLFDMMVVGALLLVIMMTTKNYITVRKLEKRIEDFVRKQSISRYKKQKR